MIPEFDEANIIVTYLKHSWIPYIKHYCQEVSDIKVEEDTIVS